MGKLSRFGVFVCLCALMNGDWTKNKNRIKKKRRTLWADIIFWDIYIVSAFYMAASEAYKIRGIHFEKHSTKL